MEIQQAAMDVDNDRNEDNTVIGYAGALLR